MKRFKTLVNPLSRKRGAVAVLTVVMLVVLFGFASLTIDVGVMFNTRAELQNAADGAALAGAGALDAGPSAVRARAREITTKQRGLASLDVRDEDILLGKWDVGSGQFSLLTGADEAKANAVRVITRMTKQHGNPVQLYFAALMGHHTADVTASATASFGKVGRWDVVIVQDVTTSFVDEIDEARIADQGLLDCIRDHAPDTYLGLVVFTGYGKKVSSLQSVDVAYNSLSASIGSFKPCGKTGMPPCSGTNIGAGIDAAIPLLTASTTERPRAIIIVSDGMPNSSLPGYSHEDLADWAIDSADQAAASDISVFTLFFSGNDGSPGATAFLAGLVRGQGTAHATPDPDELATELQEICLEGMSLMLVE